VIRLARGKPRITEGRCRYKSDGRTNNFRLAVTQVQRLARLQSGFRKAIAPIQIIHAFLYDFIPSPDLRPEADGPTARPLFLDFDDDVGLAQLFCEACILTLQLFHFVCQGMALGLGPAFLRIQGLPNPLSSFSSPIQQQRGVQTFATEKRADAAADRRSRLRFAQDAHFVFRGVATPLGSGHDFSGSGCEAAGRASAGTGAPLRCGSLRSPPLRSAPAPAPAPETTPQRIPVHP
jgi:hypothetical protein